MQSISVLPVTSAGSEFWNRRNRINEERD